MLTLPPDPPAALIREAVRALDVGASVRAPFPPMDARAERRLRDRFKRFGDRARVLLHTRASLCHIIATRAA